MKRKWKFLGVVIVGGIAIASLASKNRAFDACMARIHVDVIPIKGESWQQHTARMDEVAKADCREWS